MILCMKFGWNLMKNLEGEVVRKSWNRTFCTSKVHRMTPNQTQGIRHQKYPRPVHCSTPSPKFSSVSLYDQPFSRYCTFTICPLTSMLKFQSATKFLIFRKLPKHLLILHFFMTALLIIKFGSDRIQNVGGVAFWNFHLDMVLC